MNMKVTRKAPIATPVKTALSIGGLSAITLTTALFASFSPAQAQTTGTGRTLQELQGTVTTSGSQRALPDLQSGAAASETERSSRARNYTGNSADSPTINTSATGGNDGVIARLSTTTGRNTVRLNNQTGDEVTYEVIGQTQPRQLAAGEVVTLEALPMPTTITAERRNFGLVDIQAVVSEDGILDVSLGQSEFDEVQGALRIREDGYVFVN